MTAAVEQNLWTWVITSAVMLGYTLFVALWFTQYLTNDLGLSEGIVVLIITAASAGLGSFIYFYLTPLLNEAFAGAPTVNEVDPNTLSAMRFSGQLVKVFGFAAVCFVVAQFVSSKNAASKKKAKKVKSDSKEELIAKLSTLIQ